MPGLFRARRGRVSVVVPLYNHADYIADAIASIQAQGPIVGEIVVIDDGSTDASAEVMRGLASRDRRIRFRTQPNQGAHATLNAAMRDCQEPMVAVLNSDDQYEPGRLDRLSAALDETAGADIAASAVTFINGDGQQIANTWHDDAVAFWRMGPGLGPALVNGNFLVSTSNFLIRRESLRHLGAFAALRYAHDLDFALRVLALGHQIAIVDQKLLRYRIHAANTIAEEHARVRAEWAMVAAAYQTTLWDRDGAAPIDWEAASALQDVLLRHELIRAVALCSAYLRRHASAPLDRGPMLSDAAFKARVQGLV